MDLWGETLGLFVFCYDDFFQVWGTDAFVATRSIMKMNERLNDCLIFYFTVVNFKKGNIFYDFFCLKSFDSYRIIERTIEVIQICI